MVSSMQFAAYQTAWSQIPAATQRRLILTGSAAIEQYLDGAAVADQETVIAYADIARPPAADLSEPAVKEVLTENGFVIPAGEQQSLTVVLAAPPDADERGSVRVATPAVALRDYRTENPRLFTYRLQHDPAFRELAEAHVPTLVERHDDLS